MHNQQDATLRSHATQLTNAQLSTQLNRSAPSNGAVNTAHTQGEDMRTRQG